MLYIKGSGVIINKNLPTVSFGVLGNEWSEEVASTFVVNIKKCLFLFPVPQSELFPDKLHGGRIFYNEAIMSAMGIPQVQWHGECRKGVNVQ